MSLEFYTPIERDELVEFLAAEYEADTGIPVHLYSVVNARMSEFNGMLAITDNKQGTMFLEEPHMFKSYGSGNPVPMMRVLNQCGMQLTVR